MTLMQWGPHLDIGVESMNAEHRELIALMNALHDKFDAGATGTEVITLVQKLGALCLKHFADEEAFMASINFEGLPSHKLIHKQLAEKYTRYAEDITKNGGKMSKDFFSFLQLWLSAHIQGIDAKYGAVAQRKKAS